MAKWFDQGWSAGRKITIPAAQVGSGGVASFTALVGISATDLAAAKPDRGDYRASLTDDDSTRLALDSLGYWNGYQWFRIGPMSLSSASDNEMYIWYGNASATLPDRTDTFGGASAYDANWTAYWWGESRVDRTAGAYSLGFSGSVAAGSGTGLSGPSFQVNGGYYRIDDGAMTGGSAPYSYSCIFAQVSAYEDGRILDKIGRYAMAAAYWSSPPHTIGLLPDTAGVWRFRGFATNDNDINLWDDTTPWYAARASWPGSSGSTYIGDRHISERNLNGFIAHLGFHSNERDEAWMLTERQQCMYPATWAVIGDEFGPDSSSFSPWFIPCNRVIGAA